MAGELTYVDAAGVPRCAVGVFQATGPTYVDAAGVTRQALGVFSVGTPTYTDGAGVARSAVGVFGIGGLAPASPAITNFTIQGDSLTGDTLTPGTRTTTWAWLYLDNPPSGFTVSTVRARNSRHTGFAADLNSNDGFTLMSTVAQDATTHGGGIIVCSPFGTNDLTSGGYGTPGANRAAGHIAAQVAYYSALKAAGCKYAYGIAPPMRSDKAFGVTGYDEFTATRNALLTGSTNVRNPAVWKTFADYYIPSGEDADLNLADNTAYIGVDGVHETGPAATTTTGQARLYRVNKAALDTIAAAARLNSTTMYDSAWLTSEGSLAASETITRRFVVKGLAHEGIALTGANGLSVSGAGSPELRRGGDGGPGWATTYSGWLYNGDIIDVRLTAASASNSARTITLKVGSESRDLTFTTVASVTPASYVDGGYDNKAAGGGPTSTFAGKAFDTGLAIVALDTNGYPASAVSVGGNALIKVRDDGFMQVWAGAVSAGSYDIAVTQASGYIGQLGVLWGTAKNVDPTPVASGASSAADVPPHSTPSLSRPASGLHLGFINYIGLGDPAATVGIHVSDATSVLVRQGAVTQTGATSIIAVARRSATGSIAFDNTAGYGGPWRTGIVFKAAGT